MARASGHVKLAKRKRGDVWFLKYRTPSGKQIEEKLGLAWTGRTRPPAGYFTRRMAEDALRDLLTDLRRGDIADPGLRSGRTLGEAVTEWLRYLADEEDRRPSTLRDYRNTARSSILEEIGEDTPLEEVDLERIERFRRDQLANEGLSRRSVQKQMVMLHGILKQAKSVEWIHANPAVDAKRVKVRRADEYNYFSIEQIEAVAGAAQSELFRAAIVVAVYTGLRTGELRALRWRDVDFVNAVIRVQRNMPAGGEEGSPKSGKGRSVPLMDDAARALDGLSRREHFTEADDRVFANDVGGILGEDAFRKALYEAMKTAGIDRKTFPAKGGFTFHDLRHTFGTLAVQVFPLVDVQAYMGHADIHTTMRYAHFVPKVDAARQLTEAIGSMRDAKLPGSNVSPNLSQLPGKDQESTGPTGTTGIQRELTGRH